MCAKTEAVLFASGSPVPISKLMEILNVSLEELDEIIKMLDKKYKKAESGISLVLINDSYQLCTKTGAAEYVKKALELISEYVDTDETVGPDSQLIADLGLNSLELLEIINDIEEKNHLTISDEELNNIITVGDMAELIKIKGL